MNGSHGKNFARLLRPRKVESLRRGWLCPDEERLAAYADMRLDEAARSRVQSHLADCDYCRSQIAALLHLAAAPVPDVPGELIERAQELPKRESTATFTLSSRWAAIATATACLAFAAAVWLRRPDVPTLPQRPSAEPRVESPSPPPVPPPITHATKPRAVRNGSKSSLRPRLLAPREGSAVVREGLEFRWTEVRGSLFYEIRLMTEEGDLIWEGRSESTSLSIPSGVQLLPRVRYYVSVRAYLQYGKTSRSPVVGFSILEKK